ncbi:transient receptor potential protein-like [Trichosurus vulpecula]|uniref:transient receptor potential protein-like n=1 Tax=Trichosurus vulpecula TaxID=9337 RepID=UPI00186B08B0|nr:transient receptor potential protein-like [Trichosurus vulpecula]
MPQKRRRMRATASAEKPERGEACHTDAGEKTRPHHREDEDKARPTPKSRRRSRRSEGGERPLRTEGEERGQSSGQAEGGERPIEAEESERPVQAKQRKKPAKAEGIDRPVRSQGKERAVPVEGRDTYAQAEGSERPARTKKKEKPAKVEEIEKPGEGDVTERPVGVEKPSRSRKSAPVGRPERGGKPAEAEKSDEREKPAGAEKKPKRAYERHRFYIGDIPPPVLSRRRLGFFAAEPDSTDSSDEGEPSNVAREEPIHQFRSVKTALFLLLSILLILSLIFFIYWTFPELTEEEKATLKVPRNMEEAKALGQLLLKYKDNFFLCKKRLT